MGEATQKISLSEAVKLLKEHDGRFFSVWFIKRTDGKLRHMVCRFGVKKFAKGVGAKYIFEDKNLMSVVDMELLNTNNPYRSINLETIKKLKLNGITYIVED